MKKLLAIAALLAVAFSMPAMAKEKLYIVNSGSTSGSFNAIMSTYAEELKSDYDVTYVQAKGCNKMGAVLSRIGDAKAYYISQGLKVARTLSGKDTKCKFMPTEQNYVRSDIKYGMMFTKTGAVNGKDLLTKPLTIAYNGNTNETWLKNFSSVVKQEHRLVRYKNSKGVVLAVLNGEVDAGLVNSTKYVWKHEAKLTGLYSLNPDGDNGVPALKDTVNFDGAARGQVDNFLVKNFDAAELEQFKAIVRRLHGSQSIVSQWYSTAKGYGSTLGMSDADALELSLKFINGWVTK